MQRVTSKLNRAFSLVEVVMSIGVVALAFVPLLGLIPSSLSSFRKSMDTAIGSQIAQKMITEAVQTDFDMLIDNDHLQRDKQGDVTPVNYTFLKQFDYSDARGNVVASHFRYFDEQGNELSNETGAVYYALMRVNPQVPLPGAGQPVPDLRNLAQVTVQVVSNPGNRTIPVIENCASDQNQPLRNLVNPSGRFPTYTAVALVPRNQ